jgi:hypothetical protein
MGNCRSWTALSQLRRDERVRINQLMAQGGGGGGSRSHEGVNESERTSEGAADLEVPGAAKRNRASRVAYSQYGFYV